MSSPGRPPLSPDGRWVWDGYQWRPVVPALDHTRMDRWLTAGAIVAFLALALPGSVMAWALGSGHSPTDLRALGQAVAGCDSSAFQPSAPVAAGRFCQGIRVGAQLLTVDCSNPTEVQQRMAWAAVDSSGKAGGRGTVDVSNGSCVLTAPSGEEVQFGPQQLEPKDVVVVADFTPPATDIVSLIGLQLRCATSCLEVLIDVNGDYEVAESTPTAALKQLAGTPSTGAPIRPAQPNRLIASLKGSSVSILLNGSQIFSGRTQIPDNGPVVFLNHDLDTSHNSVVKMGSISIFNAG